MRKLVVLLLCCFVLGGCGNFDSSDQNLYEIEELEEKKFGMLTFEIPKSWNDGAKDKEGFVFYYSDTDLKFGLKNFLVDFTNDEFIDTSEEYLSGIKKSDKSFNYESMEVITISGIKALEIRGNTEQLGIDVSIRNLSFVSSGKLYSFSVYVNSNSKKDYKVEWESLEESLSILIPHNFEIDEGIIQLSDVYIQQSETEHGYTGWIAFEFDLTNLNQDERYWFEKEYSIYIVDNGYFDKTSNYIELNDFSEMQSEIQDNGKKYIFWLIGESKIPYEEREIFLNVDMRKSGISEEKLEIKGNISDFKIFDIFPYAVKDVFDKLIWEKR